MWRQRLSRFSARHCRVALSQWGLSLIVALCLAAIGLGASPALSTMIKLGSAPVEEETKSETEVELGLQDRVRVSANSRSCRYADVDAHAVRPRAVRTGRHWLRSSRLIVTSPTHLIGSGIQLRF